MEEIAKKLYEKFQKDVEVNLGAYTVAWESLKPFAKQYWILKAGGVKIESRSAEEIREAVLQFQDKVKRTNIFEIPEEAVQYEKYRQKLLMQRFLHMPYYYTEEARGVGLTVLWADYYDSCNKRADLEKKLVDLMDSTSKMMKQIAEVIAKHMKV